MKKILVIGGTGAMGLHLVDLLNHMGYHVTVTSRSRDDIGESVRYLKGDAHDPIFLKTILKRERWLAIIDFMVYSTTAFKARVEELLGSTEQYFFISSARVYAQSSTPLTEESPRLLDVSTDEHFLATDEYALSKARQENILFSSHQFNWTIVRPYITFSRERLQLGTLEKEDWLFRALNNRSIIFSNDINERLTTLTYGEDVAKAIASLIGRPEALGEVFHITSPKMLRWSTVLNAYLDTLQVYTGLRPKVVLTDLATFMKAHPATYQINYDRLYDRTFNCKKIDRYIDTHQFKDPLQSLCLCLENFLVQPRFKHFSAKYDALKDRVAHERTPFSQIPDFANKVLYTATRYFNI